MFRKPTADARTPPGKHTFHLSPDDSPKADRDSDDFPVASQPVEWESRRRRCCCWPGSFRRPTRGNKFVGFKDSYHRQLIYCWLVRLYLPRLAGAFESQITSRQQRRRRRRRQLASELSIVIRLSLFSVLICFAPLVWLSCWPTIRVYLRRSVGRARIPFSEEAEAVAKFERWKKKKKKKEKRID